MTESCTSAAAWFDAVATELSFPADGAGQALGLWDIGIRGRRGSGRRRIIGGG